MKPTSIDPLTLPSLPLTNHRKLPNCPAIYFVLDDSETVLYIGRTGNLQQRWIAHHRWSQFANFSGNVRVAWMECTDASLLLESERVLIEHFQPLLNGSPAQTPKIIAYMEPELKAAAEKLAKKQRRSVSSLVCLLLEEAVKQEQQEAEDKAS